MIPNVEKSVEVQSNISADSTGQFSVDESALGHIMDVLTNLYSDPEGAVVREYLTNAFDAHVEAGMKPGVNWTPIKVTTPSHFNKSYIIRDYGVGMSVNDLKETYSKYGKSTKTTSNDVVGMLGLGSKCGLTYTNSFTITGIKNGVKSKAIISKNEENIPVFHIVDTRATDEPNGVEISIPVKDRNSFALKTKEFLKYWEKGLVLVDDNEPEHHNHEFVKGSAITYTVEGKEVRGKASVYLVEGMSGFGQPRAESKIVMGNVAYPVEDQYVPSTLSDNNLGFVAFVPMGAVNFPPNREGLYYSPAVKSVITQISEGVFEHVLKMKLDAVAAAATYVEAWKRYAAIPYTFQRTAAYTNLKYKGEEFNKRIQHDHMILDWDYQGHGQIAHRAYIDMSNAMVNGVLFVTGVGQHKKPTSYFKKKVKHYMTENNMSYDSALLVDKDTDSKWFAHLPRVSADDIKAIKLPKSGNASGPRAEAEYEYWYFDKALDKVVSDSSLTLPKGTLAYISPADMRETYRKSGTRADVLMTYMPKDVILVVLGNNRFEKFLRTYPNAKPARTIYQDEINRLVKATSNNEYIVQQLNYNERDFLMKVDVAELDDPDLVDLANIVKGNNKSENYTIAANMNRFGPRANIHTTLPVPPAVTNTVSKRYPLIESIGARKMKHVVYYINAVYQAEYV